ncbi:MAG: sigma-70 family RNA polymerase sigma factor [Deltaproteobacteria bacterium]|nr:sigma-70 family RNA polymerase sigma factor [Deltaproteobacteria bacterium]
MSTASKMETGARVDLDELTLRRAQRGDEGACRDLVVCYQDLVFGFLARTLSLGRADQVEDVAQETFLQVFRSLGRFSPSGPARLSTWILTIASRRAIDAIRRRPPAHRDLTEVEVASSSRADDGLRQRAMAARVRAAIDELAPEFRAAFVLRSFHGLDYQEIAVALGIEIGTVKSRLARARRRLSERLEELEQ